MFFLGYDFKYERYFDKTASGKSVFSEFAF